MNYLSFDIGTTCCKCQLFSEDGNILEYLIKEYEFKHIEENNYIDVDAIWTHFSNMVKNPRRRKASRSFGDLTVHINTGVLNAPAHIRRLRFRFFLPLIEIKSGRDMKLRSILERRKLKVYRHFLS